MKTPKLYFTSGTEEMAKKVFSEFRGIDLEIVRPNITKFSNENIEVQVEDVRDSFVVVLHTQVPPVSHGLIELIALLDALQNARPKDILAVFPYLPYSRSDRKNKPRISVMAKTIAEIISAKTKKVLLLDPHDSHIKHYFNPAADEITAVYLLTEYVKREIISQKGDYIILFSDPGSAKRFERIPSVLNLPTAYIDKSRPDNSENPNAKNIVGNIKNKDCLMFDDEVLTGGTSVRDMELVKKENPKSVSMFFIHPILENKDFPDNQFLLGNLISSGFKKIVAVNTVPVEKKTKNFRDKITILPMEKLLAEAIKRAILGESLSELHKPEIGEAYYKKPIVY